MSDIAIELDGITKRYGEFTAVRDMSLRIPVGSTYGLLGPNGAGKTTTIRMILRIIEQTRGEIRVLGRPVTRELLDRVGYLPEERGVYKKMSVRRLLTFLAELKGVGARESGPRIERWLDRLELSEWRDAKVEELSKGMQQKLQFIGTVLHEPDVVILDEPFSGLDPINQRVLREIIADLRSEGRTILFSTHIIEHAERICDHVCIIAGGLKVTDGTIPEVKREHGEQYVAVAGADGHDPEPVLSASRAVTGVRQQAPGSYTVSTADGADANALLAELVERGIRLNRFEVIEPTLEQVFIQTVGDAAGRQAAEDVELEKEVSHV